MSNPWWGRQSFGDPSVKAMSDVGKGGLHRPIVIPVLRGAPKGNDDSRYSPTAETGLGGERPLETRCHSISSPVLSSIVLAHPSQCS